MLFLLKILYLKQYEKDNLSQIKILHFKIKSGQT